jgi:hypothetical protein
VADSRARRRWVVRGPEFSVRGGDGRCGVTNSRVRGGEFSCEATMGGAGSRILGAGRRIPVRGGDGRCGATNSPCEAARGGAGRRMARIAARIDRARSRALSVAARVGRARPRSPVRGPELRASHLRGAVRGPDRPCELPRLRAGAVDHEGYAGLSAHSARRAASEITTRDRAHPPDLASNPTRVRSSMDRRGHRRAEPTRSTSAKNRGREPLGAAPAPAAATRRPTDFRALRTDLARVSRTDLAADGHSDRR